MRSYLLHSFSKRCGSYEQRIGLLQQFLDERCEAHEKYRQPIRELSQEWQAWLFFQGAPAAWRNIMHAHWLREMLTKEPYFALETVVSNGRRQIKGYRLDPERTPFPPAHRQGDLFDATGEIASMIPLEGATPAHRPPNDEILRRFLATCCELHPQPEHHLGMSTTRLMRSWAHEPIGQVTRAFGQWLDEQQVSPSLRKEFAGSWIRDLLKDRGYSIRVDTTGYTMVYGLSLVPPYAVVPSPSGAPDASAPQNDEMPAGDSVKGTSGQTQSTSSSSSPRRRVVALPPELHRKVRPLALADLAREARAKQRRGWPLDAQEQDALAWLEARKKRDSV